MTTWFVVEGEEIEDTRERLSQSCFSNTTALPCCFPHPPQKRSRLM
jgi:hypothetical protein